MFPKLLSVKAIQKYSLHLRYDDGAEGTVDLSHLAGRGVFRQWDDKDLFSQVSIDKETNALIWNEILDLDPDNLYLQIRGLNFEQFIGQKRQRAYAPD